MIERDDIDLQIMLEVVRYISRREERPERPATITDLLQNLPPGANVNTIIGAIINSEETSVGDTYKTGQAGAVGPKSMGLGNTFSQVWNEQGAEIDLSQLAAELNILRKAAHKAAGEELEHAVAVGALAQAEQAASEGDGPRALECLRNAGKWVLGVAQSVGVPIAIKAIETSLGVPG